MSHEGFDHIPRQDIRAVLFASMQFDGDLTVNAFVDFIVKGNEMSCVNMLGKVDLGPRTLTVILTGNFFSADNRRLGKALHDAGIKQKGPCSGCTHDFHKISSRHIFHNNQSLRKLWFYFFVR